METLTPKKLAEEYAHLLRKSLGSCLKNIILFGSQARGSASEGSDFDIIVVVDKRTSDIREAILDAGVEMMNKYSTLFAAIIYSEDEWRKTQGFPLAWNVAREGIHL